MPRDLWRLRFDDDDRARNEFVTGTLLSPITLTPFGTGTVTMPVADVLLSGALVCGVPIAALNHELRYARLTSPVDLRRSPSGRLEIVGLSARQRGHIFSYGLNVQTGVVSAGTAYGFDVRSVSLEELGLATPGGFGQTPLLALALYDPYGRLIQLIGGTGGVTVVRTPIPPVPNTAISTTLSSPTALVSLFTPTSVTTTLVPVAATAHNFTVTTLSDSGGGSLRDAITRAVAAGGNATIRFAVGGTIRPVTQLPTIGRNLIHVLGETAPSPIVLDGGSCALPLFEQGAVNISGRGCVVRRFTVQNFVDTRGSLHGVQVGAAGSDSVLEDIRVSNWSTRGGIRVLGAVNVSIRRCTATGTRGEAGFLLSSGGATLEDCDADGCTGGYRIVGGTHNLFRCLGRNSSWGAWAGINAGKVALVDCIFQDLSSFGLLTDSIPMTFLRTLVQRVTGVGVRMRRTSLQLMASVMMQGCVITECSGDGLIAEGNWGAADLGGGSLGSLGFNFIKGNGGVGLRNSLSPTRLIKAERNSWDHATVSEVLALDTAGGNIDVDPLV
jgi:hypothetical protein